ncbi:SH3 domain-containing protein [Cellulophaga sp. HaHaR_3_176]|uniref:SH3 domain-containing protein n=1 Tax=Cellulophaga sp. HaHaR_3_176 TaxID=1942464 RepID=UPI001C1FB2CE|nr:SH3 domain-containing protein [Cellulophaga sp. HaHaR_3_176]QWX85575.1 SH3 domain-containing protein [Cellulophaga sp. HaHaR_3_176]
MKKLFFTFLIIITINTSFAQTELLVKAKNGLNIRSESNLKSEKVGKFKYAEKIEVLEKTDIYFEIIDNEEIIKGQWYKVKGKSLTGEIVTGYVFSGFLTNPKQKDTFEFIFYDDNYDHFYFTAKKEKKTYSFITNGEEINFLRGDIIEIEWKEVFIISAGDEDIKELNNRLLSIKKIKNGIVSNFRKIYNKEIKYHYTDNYSQWYLDYIYLNIEYYIANSKNKLIRNLIEKKEQLEYSIENRNRNGTNYLVIGLSHSSEFKTSPLQWLYYNEKNSKFYEYDLPNDELIEYK